MPIKTIAQVKKEFNQAGMTIAMWAEQHGYPAYLVQQVLSNRTKCSRGQSHQIAILLGIKDGFIQTESEKSGENL